MAVRKSKSANSFEGSLEKLEKIVRQLEEEEVSLEDSLKLFGEGKELVQRCEEELQAVENKVKQLMEGPGGEDEEVEFEPEDEETVVVATPGVIVAGSTNGDEKLRGKKDELPF